MILNNF